MENQSFNNEVDKNEENFERTIALIDNCQNNNDLIEYCNKLKVKLNRLENTKRFLMLVFVLTCFAKFPKVYKYDFLLNYIAMILEMMVGLVIDCARFINKLDLDLTYDFQDLVAEVNLDAAEEIIEEKKEKVFVKIK